MGTSIENTLIESTKIQNIHIQVNTNIQETKETVVNEFSQMAQAATNTGIKMGSLLASGIKNSVKFGLKNIKSESLTTLKNDFATLFTQMAQGEDISGTLDGIKETANTFLTSLTKSLQNIGTQLPGVINTLVPAFMDLINTFVPIAMPILAQGFATIFGSIVQYMPSFLSTLVAQLPTMFQALVDAFMNADLGGKIGMAIVGGLVAFNLVQKLTPIVKNVLGLFGKVQLPTAGGAAGGGGISGFLTGLANGLVAFSNPLVLQGAVLLGASMVVLSGAAWASIQIISNALPTLATALSSFNAINGVNLLAVGGGLIALGAGLVAITAGSIIDGLAKLFGGGFEQALRNIIEPIATLMPLISPEDITKFSLLGTGLLALGLGFNMVKGFNSGQAIADSISAIHGAVLMVFLTGGIVMYQGVSNNLIALSKGLIQLGAVVPNPAAIVGFLTSISNKIQTLNNFDWTTAVTNMKTKGEGIGKAVADGIKSGITNNAFLFIDAIGVKIDEMVAEAKRKAKINSPSKVFEKEVGYWIGAGTSIGVSKGIDDYMPNSISTIKAGLSGYELDSNSRKLAFPNELKIIDGDGIVMRVSPVIDEKIIRNNINKGIII